MKKIIALSVMAILAVGPGCGNKKPASSSSSASTNTTLSPEPPRPQMPVTPVTPAESMPKAADSAPVADVSGGPVAGSRYVVKRGDTLWNIATRAYGDGKQWKKIAAANNIKGERVVVGQALTLP